MSEALRLNSAPLRGRQVTDSHGRECFVPEIDLGSGSISVSVGAQVAPTSHSGSISGGGSAQVLMAANAARLGWYIQNTSSDRLYVEDRTAAGTANASAAGTSIELDPGDAYYPPFASPNAISVFGPTTGQTFAAGEW